MADGQREAYREACDYAEGCVREYMATPPGDRLDPYDYAHECADGAACVIYHWRAFDVYGWASEVRDYEEDAQDGLDPGADILTRVSVTVYYWLVALIADGIASKVEAEARKDGAA